MKRILVEVAKGKTQTASSKARDDVTTILASRGFEVAWVHVGDSTDYRDLLKDLHSSHGQLKEILADIEPGSVLAFQYPWDSQMLAFARAIKKTAKKKGLTTIALVHDLNSLRTQSALGLKYYQLMVNEYAFLDCFDYVICHNAAMAEHLFFHQISGDKLIRLDLFDYLLANEQIPSRVRFARTVSVAGNLSPLKAPYVSLLPQLGNKSYSFELYGVGYEGRSAEGVLEYKGSFDPDELPLQLDHGFGLVWDGDSLDGCVGPLGTYERYNNPHKLSLYHACGMPVIVWAGAATASFVKERETGLVVRSLFELEDVLASVTQEQFEHYASNARAIGALAREGAFLNRALAKIPVLQDEPCPTTDPSPHS